MLFRSEVAALPGTKLEGPLSFVSATVQPETRTVRVRMELPNPDGRFKPSMLATVTLLDQPEQLRTVAHVPVQRRREHAELGRERSHAERVGAALVDQPERCLDDQVARDGDVGAHAATARRP